MVQTKSSDVIHICSKTYFSEIKQNLDSHTFIILINTSDHLNFLFFILFRKDFSMLAIKPVDLNHVKYPETDTNHSKLITNCVLVLFSF